MLLVLVLLGCLESPSRPDRGADKVAAFQAAKAVVVPRGGITVTVTGKAGPVAGAAVWLGDTGDSVAPRTASLSLKGAALDPALVVLPAGSAISLHNKDGHLRTVQLVDPKATETPPPALASRELAAGATAGLPLSGTGPRRLVCGPEACPDAAVVVGTGGITDASGQVALTEVPAGPVRVHVWHPTLGEAAVTAEISASTVTNTSLALP